MSQLLFTRIGIAVLAAIVTLTSVSCSTASSSNLHLKPINPTSTTNSIAAKPKIVVNPKLIEANTRFSFNLFSKILKQDGKNVFVSPSSVAISLSMVHNGAKGETRQAIAKALEMQGMSLSEINQANASLKTSLESSDPGVQLTIANSLWARKGVDFKPEFIQRNQTFYAAEVESLDFADPSAPGQINGWVKKITQGKISEIVDRIDADQVMFLINAIYFKGKWMTEFDKSQTTDRPFNLANGRQKQHPMMSQKGEYRYYETQQFQAVSLAYGKGRTSLYVFLPKPNSSLAEFQKTLT
ncbi:MAG: serpin family protein, partial [Phormidesmis sp. CAN_BIN36]|nr:serpin family protein [Phormidesmis sp. CAN_BIN36]